MIVRRTKDYEQNSLFLNTDWYDEGNFVIDETTEEGKVLAEKIIKHAPYFEFVTNSKGNLIDITPTKKPEEPKTPPIPTAEERLQALEDAMLMLTLGGM